MQLSKDLDKQIHERIKKNIKRKVDRDQPFPHLDHSLSHERAFNQFLIANINQDVIF